MFKDRFWIIGHQPDFDYILLGRNTGPYPDFRRSLFFNKIKGEFYHLYNFIGQTYGRKFIVFLSFPFSKCDFLDKLNKNVKEPERCFDSPGEVGNYIKNQAREIIESSHFSSYSKENIKDLENFLKKQPFVN